MASSIEGRGVVVTGASKGIGKGIAQVFARAGAKVAIVARGAADCEATAEEIRAAGGIAEACPCDVTDWAAVRAMVARVRESFGGVDVLCANAGIFPQSKIIDMDPAEWDHVLTTNLKSTFLLQLRLP